MSFSTRTIAAPRITQISDLKHDEVVLETEIEPSSEDESKDSLQTDHIYSSPYTDTSHQLDLRSLSPSVAQFARALTSMRNTKPDYATAPYAAAFNWTEIVNDFARQSDVESELSFFVIVFRSRLKEDANRELLGKLDKAAHLEAVEAGGLLKYWFGTPDYNRRNIATCIWRARDDARLGGAGEGHVAAMVAARRVYDEWIVERLKLTIDIRSATWRFDPWVD